MANQQHSKNWMRAHQARNDPGVYCTSQPVRGPTCQWVETSVAAGDEVRFEPTSFEELRDYLGYAGSFWAVAGACEDQFAALRAYFVLTQIDGFAEAHEETGVAVFLFGLH